MQEPYSAYPTNILIGRYYWLRRKTDLNLKIVQAVKREGDYITVSQENAVEIVVSKGELLEFSPENKLFKCLMNNSVYRQDQYLKRILQLQGFDPETYMIMERKELNTFDSTIDKKRFYTEYAKFTRAEGFFGDETMVQIKDFIVTGTHDLDIYSLYKKVCENGGMERITNDQKWKLLFYSTMSKTNVSYTIRTSYKKYLYEFEFLRREREDGVNYGYMFNIRDNIYINVGDEVYYGTVKLRRNRGLNQYYIQFYLWSRENSEWFSEDQLKLYPGKFTSQNYIKRKTRSSKANNLIDDPLTREKHAHLGSRSSKHINQPQNEKIRGASVEAINQKGSCDTLPAINFVTQRSIQSHERDESTINTLLEDKTVAGFNSIKEINNDPSQNNNTSTDMKKNNERQENKKKSILERNTSKKKRKIIKMLQEMNLLDESGKMTENNYMFLGFFNLK